MNLKELIGSNCIENRKVKRARNTFTIGKSSPCLSKTGNLCCSQLRSTTTFISQQTKEKIKIYHKVNCKSEYVIYFMECTVCNKQYVGKSQTVFNIRLNNHGKEVVYSGPTLDNLLEAQGKILHPSACIPIFIIFFAYNLIIKSINKAHTKILNLYTSYSSTRFSRVSPLYTTLKYQHALTAQYLFLAYSLILFFFSSSNW